jgi:hypothetical protein
MKNESTIKRVCNEKKATKPKKPTVKSVTSVTKTYTNDQVGKITIKVTRKLINVTIDRNKKSINLKPGMDSKRRPFDVFRNFLQYNESTNNIVFTKSQSDGSTFQSFKISVPSLPPM